MGGIVIKRAVQAALVIGLVASQLVGWAGVTAQESMPGTEAVSPDPAQCQVEARTIEGLKAVFAAATPTAEQSMPATVAVPTGRSADTTTAAGVVATVEEAFACLNGGDFMRFFALLTDNAIVTAFPWIAEQVAEAEDPADLGLPLEVPVDQRQTLLAVAGISRLGDGRVGATIAFIDPESDSPGADALFLVFLLRGDRWLIDEVFDFSGA